MTQDSSSRAKELVKQVAATGGGVADPAGGAICPHCLNDVDGDFAAGLFPIGHARGCVWVQCRQLAYEMEAASAEATKQEETEVA